MDRSNLLENTNLPGELIKLGQYQWPRSEARQTLGTLFERVKGILGFNADDEAIDPERLETVSDEEFRNRLKGAVTAILTAMLDKEYGDWAISDASGEQRRLFIYPPMGTDILAEWARQKNIPTLTAKDDLSYFSDAPCVVLPKLETFFGRDPAQLSSLFDLFGELSRFEGKVLIGCNSWAWRFLQQIDDANLLFGEPATFPAFNANALAAILEDIPRNEKRFVSVASGEPILDRDDDGKLKDPFLENLAGSSLGHPWVAIEMFLKGISVNPDAEEDDVPSGGRTWVELPKRRSLFSSGSDAPLFALHALMIHGSRNKDVLNTLLPKRVPNGVWLELGRSGFVDMNDEIVSCAIHAYPDIRSELTAAGFNTDNL